MKRKLQFFMTLLLLFGGVSGVWADDTSVTFANGITWERAHGISTFDDTNKVITGTTSNWGAIGYKTASGTSYKLKKDRLTWLVITGTNLNKGTNNPCVFNINGDLGDAKIKYVDNKSSATQIVIDITKKLPNPDGSDYVEITSLGFYLDDPNGTAEDHEITENQPTITNIEIVYPETDTPIHAMAEICYRSNADNNGWQNTWDGATNAEFEINYNTGFFALQKYEVENLAAVKSLTVHIYGDGIKGWHDAMAIWAFNDNEWTTSSDASTLVGKVADVVGIAPRATTGTANTPLVNGTSNRYTADGVQHCLFVISGDALATLKEAATDNTFTLLITNRTGDLTYDRQRKYYTSGQTIVPFRPYIEVTPYPAVVGNVGYETLNAAFDGITTSGTINLYDDITITSRCNTGSKTISVIPTKAVKISSSLNNSIWILNDNSSGSLTIGADDYQITIDGGHIENNANHIETSKGTTILNNVRFLDCLCSKATDNKGQGGIINIKGTGKLDLKNCVFDGCTASTQNDDSGIVFVGTTEVYIKQNISFVNCTGNGFFEERYLRVADMNEPTTPIAVYRRNAALGSAILSSTNSYTDKSSWFKVTNDGYGLCYKSSNADCVLTEAYTMTMNAYGASTLILPYDAKIPVYGDAAAYTLNYNTGNTVVRATEVETTIPANTPVLLNAAAGEKLWFVNTALVESTTNNDGANHTSGALTGVYATTMVPEGSYILYADKSNPIGFYKSNNSTVAANRAYLTADGAAARSITVVYDDDELTGIKSVESGKVQAEGVYYDLSGRRVAQPTKGLYIVNGKKVIIK